MRRDLDPQRRCKKYIFLVVSSVVMYGCSPTTKTKQENSQLDKVPSVVDLATGKESPPTGDDLDRAVGNWAYGPGLGRTMLNVGTVVVFPPYALYLLGNAALAFTGCEPVYITDALPDSSRGPVLDVYGAVASVPGRVVSVTAGEDYRENYREVSEDADERKARTSS